MSKYLPAQSIHTMTLFVVEYRTHTQKHWVIVNCMAVIIMRWWTATLFLNVAEYGRWCKCSHKYKPKKMLIFELEIFVYVFADIRLYELFSCLWRGEPSPEDFFHAFSIHSKCSLIPPIGKFANSTCTYHINYYSSLIPR
jgi:hypothetical protein